MFDSYLEDRENFVWYADTIEYCVYELTEG